MGFASHNLSSKLHSKHSITNVVVFNDAMVAQKEAMQLQCDDVRLLQPIGTRLVLKLI